MTLLPQAFALVRETSERVLGLRHFDVQLMGGILLHEGGIAEMATGEGKTLVAILPSFLNSLSGLGVHVVTTNDYLARRDAEWVGQPLRFLGTSVGVIQSGMKSEQRKQAYACDVTYVTNSELGFDYLRDQLAVQPSELVLRAREPFHYAIVDEADSVLIDEGRTPLVVSAKAERPSEKYAIAKALAESLSRPAHYTLEEKERLCTLTDEGLEEAARCLRKEDLFDPQDPWAPFVVNALNAKEFYKRDKQYIVKDCKVVIVDEFTGRAMVGRRWSSGLHQAVEAKEGVQIEAEEVTLASISYQSLFRLFGRLSGMTGTATTEATEFTEIYNLKVSVVPTNLPCQRLDEDDLIYASDSAKWRAVACEIETVHRTGRPVLIGTTSVENSERLARRLDEVQVPYRLLNARPEYVAREAEIIAASGRRGAVTISTNMAGRGTDIVLGGNSDMLAQLRVREELFPLLFPERSGEWAMPPGVYPAELSVRTQSLLCSAAESTAAGWLATSTDTTATASGLTEVQAGEQLSRVCKARGSSGRHEQALQEAYHHVESEFAAVTEAERKDVLALGGLYVIGTERHESRRIDNQLRGRAGRQGDPGEARFFLSLTDKVLSVFGGDALKSAVSIGGSLGDVPLSSPLLSGALDEAQKQVEGFFYGIRKEVFEYDQVMDKQRRVLYGLRQRALLDLDEGLAATMRAFNDQNIEELVEQQLGKVDLGQPVEHWPLEKIAKNLSTMLMGSLAVAPEQLREVAGTAGGGAAGAAALREWAKEESREAIESKERAIDLDGAGLQHAVRRQILLMQVDQFWRRHLQNMDYLRTSVKLRAYGQQNPLVEYKREAYQAFVGMMSRIRRNAVFYLFNFQPRPLALVTRERLAAITGQQPPVHPPQALQAMGTHAKTAVADLSVEVQRRLRVDGARARDGKLLLPLSELGDTFEEAGLLERGEQLRWTAWAEGLELLEDEFAKAVYVGLKE